ncbi:hypothetical protein [Mobilicoccus sp.]|uniref:hypothetical protein n=1 Tax=Mobilicoccus sp. TaxID=2034349 RepID=UPI0028AE6C54|nr:hypothetical protein [Mobilicoccus sp.]
MVSRRSTNLAAAAATGDHVAVMRAAVERLAAEIDATSDVALAGQLIDRLVRAQAGLIDAERRAAAAAGEPTTSDEDEVAAARKARAERRSAKRQAKADVAERYPDRP